ncbi:MAG: hypothetical protein AAF558_01700 [Verrucomicrobiota bacterium]
MNRKRMGLAILVLTLALGAFQQWSQARNPSSCLDPLMCSPVSEHSPYKGAP